MNLSFKNLNYKASLVANIPTPSSISYMWNFGSLLGLCLVIQIFSGLFISMHYDSSMDTSFFSVVKICNDVNMGWVIRSIHANGASMFFIFIYFHIGRGLYYSSFKLVSVWLIGLLILLLLMAVSFLGYVLPWGQMSYWGATVITNLMSAVPYLGDSIVQWVWGGFSVDKPTLTRFFSIHFIMPFVLAFFVLLHLVSLHNTGSSNPLGVMMNSSKINFHPYFSVKDMMGVLVLLVFFLFFVVMLPDVFMDPDNFMEANPMNTPPHIQPEWYFLFAYAILRSIPNKLGGVVALMMSILILSIIPLIIGKTHMLFRHNSFYKLIFWCQVCVFLVLTWLGSMPVEEPYILVGQVSSLLYFVLFLMFSMI